MVRIITATLLALCLIHHAESGDQPKPDKDLEALQGIWSLQDKKKTDNFTITLELKGKFATLKLACKDPAVREGHLGNIEFKKVKDRPSIIVGSQTMAYTLKGDELTLDIPANDDPLGIDPFKGKWTLRREKTKEN